MKEIVGKYNTAEVFIDTLDEKSLAQIQLLCDQEFTSGATLRFMPDVHAGAGCTVGTTMTIKDKIVPNLVGVDIGCGMETMVIHKDSPVSQGFDGARMDKIIQANIPSGYAVRDTPHKYLEKIDLGKLKGKIKLNYAQLSMGTLGGGNHFIEADRDDEGNLYIVVHSGSRHAGMEIADYYQEEAWKQINGHAKADVDALIAQYKAEGRESEIQSALEAMYIRNTSSIPHDLAYVEGYLFDDYIADMRIMQQFATLNRQAIMDEISTGLGIKEEDVVDTWTTIHNYIDTEAMIMRKGAVSAKAGEKILIPMNMRDGSLICLGRGNSDWNYSAPHGAGRVMSRSVARKTLKLEDFKSEMSGIYSTTVNKDTIDEAPESYKPMEDIVKNITPTVDVLKVIKPIYNFKATDDNPIPLKRRRR